MQQMDKAEIDRALAACERVRVDCINAAILAEGQGRHRVAQEMAENARLAKERAERIAALMAEIERREGVAK